MTLYDIEEMGPVDYIVIEWPGRQPKGDVAPMIVDLVDRGIIRVLDVAFMVKDEDGTVQSIELGELEDGGFGEFEGASTGLIGREDLEEAATALDPGTSAAVSNRVSRRQARRWGQQEEYYEPEPAYQQAPQAPPPAPAPDPIEQLKELAALKAQGVLTDAEFSAQ